MTKTIKSREECYIEFSDEELTTLGWQPGDKLSWQITEEGVTLKKCEEIDIDLKEFSKEELIDLITVSSARDITVEELIVEVLREAVESGENSSYNDITHDEYCSLLSSGVFWEEFPNATGSWRNDYTAYQMYLADREFYNGFSGPNGEPLPMREWLRVAEKEDFDV